jgi:membrane protein implicated in regulation of membrane protease activity
MNDSMKKPPWPARVIFKYLLLQIPTWVIWIVVLILLRHWIDFPRWVIAAVVILWIIKDAVLFPFVWRSYDPNQPGGSRPLIGARGIVVKSLSPQGYVDIQGELWRAEAVGEKRPIPPGDDVRVQAVRGLTLLVQSLPKEIDRDRGDSPGGIPHPIKFESSPNSLVSKGWWFLKCGVVPGPGRKFRLLAIIRRVFRQYWIDGLGDEPKIFRRVQ